jgi:D-sedoheptulose 7-phosphate isomerase
MPERDSLAAEKRIAVVRDRLEDSARVTRESIAAAGRSIGAAAGLLIEGLRSGNRVLAFGNGGSAADAQHFASELAGRFVFTRPALPAMALATNGSDLTAIGNDYGFEQVFSRLIEAHGRAGDVAVAISTSGESPNVIAAVAEARERGLSTIGLSGNGGGKLAAAVDVAVVVPSDVTPRIQETHIAICHVFCELVEAALFPDAGTT